MSVLLVFFLFGTGGEEGAVPGNKEGLIVIIVSGQPSDNNSYEQIQKATNVWSVVARDQSKNHTSRISQQAAVQHPLLSVDGIENPLLITRTFWFVPGL